MAELLRNIRTRIVPSLLVALGVTLTTAGLFTYTSPVEAGPLLDEPPVTVELPPPSLEPTVPPILPGAGESFVPSTPLPLALPAGWPTALSR